MTKIVTFGEVMGRLAPDQFLRFPQAVPGSLELTFAGAEANVAASICCLGGTARLVTALPKHAVADACMATLAGLGIDVQPVVRTDEGRLGLYFVETGANQRPGTVIYDRTGSAVSITAADAYPWSEALQGATWFHVTGITPALSKTAAEAVLAGVKTAREGGVRVSCDLNFRKKLWQWDRTYSAPELAQRTMRGILPYVDLVIGNEEDAADVLDIQAADTDVASGQLSIDRYPDVAKQIVAQFPNVSQVAITLRESLSASHNNWGAMLYDAASAAAHFAPLEEGEYRPYAIRNIVDRVGAGDAFAAGLLFALTETDLHDHATALRFVVAASCLAHSIRGDFNFTSRDEVEALMRGSGSGRVVR